MHLTLRQLKVFESVARHLSFTHAARELHLTQPAVSMQIKQLEEQAGLPLLEQFGKKNYLTEAGRELHQYSKSILQQLDELGEIMLDLQGLRRGCLDLAVATTANDFATRLLAAFSRENEHLNYRLEVTNRETLLAQLEDNEKDLVIMGRPPVGKSLDAEAFMDNPLVVIAPPDHALARGSRIPLAKLAKETFVVREKASGTRIAMERFFHEHGFELASKMEMTSNESIKNAVQAGLGLGLVSVHTVRLELETKRLVVLDVEDFPILRHWYIVHRKGKRLSTVARAFKNFVLSRAEEFAAIPENL
ncbi:MAG: LysR family transcriptional regulator [Gammaproteobacteria bacterium]